ncbi:transcription factor HES-1-A-like [Portunus trituberculatus]|uniref:transcription factor HES-1-A-like n=1 Tax=Portunus trituberculatus TaxID=210409 RepID=UPI001E1D08CB|nr:transcription factor HES-1-A-like [Portunus trituberculatus]XP_045129837.1 transcription factor HES-1-A-like [Portunus trituberculatus]
MEEHSSVEVGRHAGADAGETEVCRSSKPKQQLLQKPQQQRHWSYLDQETDCPNEYEEDEDTYPEEMTAGSSISSSHRAASVSPQACSMNRKSNKPLMEKKRRQRINRCLNDLKSLVLEGKNKDPSQYSKLEKADILEMTVRHVQALHRLGVGRLSSGGGRVLGGDEEGKYRAGFTHCVTEVDKYLRYLSGLGDLPQDVHKKLFAHLNSIATSVTSNVNTTTTTVQNSVNVMTNPMPFILVLNTTPSQPPATIAIPEAAGNSLGAQPAVTLVTTSKLDSLDSSVSRGGGPQMMPQHVNGGDVTLVLPPTHQVIPQSHARNQPSAALQASAPVLTAILTSDRGRCAPPTVVQPPALSTSSEDSALGPDILDTSDSDMSSSGLSTPLSSMSSAGSPAPADDAGRSSPRRPAGSRSPPFKPHNWSSGVFREELGGSSCHSRPAVRRHPVLAPKPTQGVWPQCPAPLPNTSKKRKDKSPPPPPAEPQSMWRPWH